MNSSAMNPNSEQPIDTLLWEIAEMNRHFPSNDNLSLLIEQCLSETDSDALSEEELSYVMGAAHIPNIFMPKDNNF